MINKEDDYLTTRLKLLKNAALSNQNLAKLPDNNKYLPPQQSSSEVNFNQNQTQNYIEMQQIESNLKTSLKTPETSNYFGAQQINNQQLSYKNGLTLPLKTSQQAEPKKLSLIEYQKKIQTENQKIINNLPSPIEIRRPRSQEIMEDFRNSFERRFGANNQQTPAFTTNLRQVPPVVMNKSSEPVTRTIYSINNASRFGQQTENNLTDYEKYLRKQDNTSNYININNNNNLDPKIVSQSSEIKQSIYPQTTFLNPMQARIASMSPLKTGPSQKLEENKIKAEQNLLDSINLQKQTFLEKHESTMIGDFSLKLNTQMSKNDQMMTDLKELRNNFERETKNTQDLNQQYNSEIKHAKLLQEETSAGIERLEVSLSNVKSEITKEDQKHTDFIEKLEHMKNENKLLRNELRRIGEITSDKILELENNINSIARMKTLEIENAEMEKDKTINSADFVIEQMRVMYAERSSSFEEQMKKLEGEKTQTEAAVKAILSELNNYNSYADQKISNEMKIIIQQEEEKVRKETEDIELRALKEENDVRAINQQNQEILTKMTRFEAESKNRFTILRNENLRLRDELANAEQNLGRARIQMAKDEKELEMKSQNLDGSKMEKQDLDERVVTLNLRYNQEIEGIMKENSRNFQELEEENQRLMGDEKKLLQLIQEEEQKINRLQMNHQNVVNKFQNDLHSLLNQDQK